MYFLQILKLKILNEIKNIKSLINVKIPITNLFKNIFFLLKKSQRFIDVFIVLHRTKKKIKTPL